MIVHDSHDFVEVDSISEAQVPPLCIMGIKADFDVVLGLIPNHVLKKMHLRKRRTIILNSNFVT